MRIGTVSDIPIHLHWSFLGLMGIFGAQAFWNGGVSELVLTTVLETALFGSVLLHELGHAMAARHYGIGTRDITLYPFGGIAAIEKMPSRPREEFFIALAGPAVNFALLAVFAVAWLATGWWVFGAIGAINLLMGVFNLIPAFPMDGGRVLRAALAGRIGWVPASEVAIRVGGWFAWGFIGVALVSGIWSLALVGGFLLFALRMERRRLAWQHFTGRDGAASGFHRPRRYIAKYVER